MSAGPDDWNDPGGAEIYDEVVRGGRLYRERAAGLCALLEPRAGARMLDLACGTGLLAGLLFARAGPASTVLGLDRSRAMLAVARRQLPVEQAEFLVADPAALPLRDGSLNAAGCSAAFWHFPAPQRVLAELRRVLVPGGRIALNVPAAQLDDATPLPPAPIQLAVAREGRARFGHDPSPGGPVLSRPLLLRLAVEAGLSVAHEGFRDAATEQAELIALLAVPAVGARFFPDAPRAARDACLSAAGASVDPREMVVVRFWELLLRRE